jgi:hypothetical protein
MDLELDKLTRRIVCHEFPEISKFILQSQDEQKDKGYAIETAASDIERYSATIEEAAGTITSMESTLATKSSTAAAKESELKDATGVREAENADFVAAERSSCTGFKI